MPRQNFPEWVWNMHEPQIAELYARCSLPEIKQIMSDQHDFNPTERMYKSRFRGWGYTPKNLHNVVYRAMERLTRPLLRQGQSDKLIEWTTCTDLGEKRYPLNNITKEIRRHKGTHNEREHLSLREAHEIVTSVNQTQVRFFYGQEEVDLDDLVALSETLEERSMSLASPSADRVGYSLPASPAARSQDQNRLFDTNGALQRRQSLEPLSSPSVGSSTVGLYAVTSGRCPRCPASCVHEDYDFDLDYRLEALTLTNPRLHAVASPFASLGPKSLVGLWAVPFAIEAMSSAPESNKALCMSSSTFQGRLRNILDATVHNKFLLPGLNWVVAVVLCNGHQELVETWLQDGCEVIEKTKGPNSFLLLPFRFTLAWLRHGKEAMEDIGQQFEFAHSKIQEALGAEDETTLVFRLYWAWYKRVCQKALEDARVMLESMVPVLRKRFGAHNTLTINCQLMLGRCYLDMGYSWKAVAVLDDALHQLGQPMPHMEAYQLQILYYKAIAEMETAQLDQAERHLEVVVKGLVRLLGVICCSEGPHDYVWEAIWNLQKVKNRLGKKVEAGRLEEEYRMKYAQEREEWYTSRGYEIPPDDTTWATQEAMALDQPMVRRESPPRQLAGQGH